VHFPEGEEAVRQVEEEVDRLAREEADWKVEREISRQMAFGRKGFLEQPRSWVKEAAVDLKLLVHRLG
jgi:hypothetical protein